MRKAQGIMGNSQKNLKVSWKSSHLSYEGQFIAPSDRIQMFKFILIYKHTYTENENPFLIVEFQLKIYSQI